MTNRAPTCKTCGALLVSEEDICHICGDSQTSILGED